MFTGSGFWKENTSRTRLLIFPVKGTTLEPCFFFLFLEKEQLSCQDQDLNRVAKNSSLWSSADVSIQKLLKIIKMCLAVIPLKLIDSGWSHFQSSLAPKSLTHVFRQISLLPQMHYFHTSSCFIDISVRNFVLYLEGSFSSPLFSIQSSLLSFNTFPYIHLPRVVCMLLGTWLPEAKLLLVKTRGLGSEVNRICQS